MTLEWFKTFKIMGVKVKMYLEVVETMKKNLTMASMS